MITLEKLDMYQKYGGDVDDWQRRGSTQGVMAPGDWSLIENFISDLKLIKRGLAAAEYEAQVREKLNRQCDNHLTLAKLEEIADLE
jgi:hypothetical protein